MLELSAIIVAQQHTSTVARSARPESPMRSVPERRWRRVPRQRISASLRRLADTIDPTPLAVGTPVLRPLS